MKRRQGILCFVLIVLLFLSSCITTQSLQNKPLDIIAVTSEISIISSEKQVHEFLDKNKSFISGYETDKCYNITPDFIINNSTYLIFKYDTSAASYLMYDDEIYKLGEFFGGYGVTSMALVDFNLDNKYELCYTFSWGSGIHRSQIGWFEPVTKEIVILDYSHMNNDMILTTNEKGGLYVNEAIVKGDSFVEFTVTSNKLVGSIVYEKDNVALKFTE